MILALLIVLSVSIASYLLGIEYGKAYSKVQDMKTIEELKKDLVELRKWKAENIGKENACHAPE